MHRLRARTSALTLARAMLTLRVQTHDSSICTRGLAVSCCWAAECVVSVSVRQAFVSVSSLLCTICKTQQPCNEANVQRAVPMKHAAQVLASANDSFEAVPHMT